MSGVGTPARKLVGNDRLLLGLVMGLLSFWLFAQTALQGLSAACMPTHLMLDQYRMLAVAGYTLFGLGLAFYATPSTDAALSNLPAAQGGSGAGIYKMASSLGAAFGVAISAAVFTALAGEGGGVQWLEGVITFGGRQDNVALREAAFVALAVNVVAVVLAIVAIAVAIPKGRKEATASPPGS